jgi:predicted metalloprotease with PDZ domain
MTPIRYAIAPLHPEAHLFAVTVTVDVPDPAGQVFTLPAWIPGSYMIRDFARNIVRIRADAGDVAVPLTKLDKQSWQAAPLAADAGPLVVSYEVYAWDLSVRAAHLDTTHGFFNGSSVFLRGRAGRWSVPGRYPRARRRSLCRLARCYGIARGARPRWRAALRLRTLPGRRLR